MSRYNTSSVGNSLKKVQDLVRRKTNHENLQEVAEKMIDDPEMRNSARQALYKIQQSFEKDQERVRLTDMEVKSLQNLLSKLSYVDSQMNRAIRNHTENLFGNYQGEDFGADR